MNTTTNEALAWRYAADAFDATKEISPEDLAYILEAGNLAPTSFGLQPFQIIVVIDQALKTKLRAVGYDQAKIEHNAALLVFAVRTDVDEAFITEYTDRIERIRELPTGSVDDYKAMMIGATTNRTAEERLIWAQKQAYIALGTMLVAAGERKIDTAPMEGFDPEQFNNMLGLAEKNLHTSVIMAIGYRSPEDEKQHWKKVRKDIDDLVIRM